MPDLHHALQTKVTKGTRFDRDRVSAFDQTGLAAELERAWIRRVWLGGVILDAG